MIRLLAVVLLFVVVRNNLAELGALRRLALAMLVNGSALAAFGLLQQFTSPPGTVYWTYPTLGRVYGPFVCKNHFAGYVNLCIGLALGLLLALRTSPASFSGGRAVPRVRWLYLLNDARFGLDHLPGWR